MRMHPSKKPHNDEREWECLTESIISSIPEGLIVYDRELRYRMWNPFMERLTGKTSESLIGKCAFDVFPHLKEQGIDKLLMRALAGEIVHSPDTPFTVPDTGKTGWVVGTYGPHRSADGTIVGVVATVRDISKRKRAEASLAAEREQLAVTVRSIAHDFNNLLGGVFGFISLARDYVATNEKAFTFLSKALNAFHRAGDLSKQLLTFTKGGAPMKKALSLEPLLRETAQFALTGSNVRCPGRILVMDGEDFIREVTREMLKVLGYDTVLAESGEEALSLVKDSIAEQNPFDAAILDLTIAGSMGGMETAKMLRSIDHNIKAIISSGYSHDPVMADPKTFGFLEKIKKPYLKEDLAEVLYRVIHNA